MISFLTAIIVMVAVGTVLQRSDLTGSWMSGEDDLALQSDMLVLDPGNLHVIDVFANDVGLDREQWREIEIRQKPGCGRAWFKNGKLQYSVPLICTGVESLTYGLRGASADQFAAVTIDLTAATGSTLTQSDDPVAAAVPQNTVSGTIEPAGDQASDGSEIAEAPTPRTTGGIPVGERVDPRESGSLAAVIGQGAAGQAEAAQPLPVSPSDDDADFGSDGEALLAAVHTDQPSGSSVVSDEAQQPQSGDQSVSANEFSASPSTTAVASDETPDPNAEDASRESLPAAADTVQEEVEVAAVEPSVTVSVATIDNDVRRSLLDRSTPSAAQIVEGAPSADSPVQPAPGQEQASIAPDISSVRQAIEKDTVTVARTTLAPSVSATPEQDNGREILIARAARPFETVSVRRVTRDRGDAGPTIPNIQSGVAIDAAVQPGRYEIAAWSGPDAVDATAGVKVPGAANDEVAATTPRAVDGAAAAAISPALETELIDPNELPPAPPVLVARLPAPRPGSVQDDSGSGASAAGDSPAALPEDATSPASQQGESAADQQIAALPSPQPACVIPPSMRLDVKRGARTTVSVSAPCQAGTVAELSYSGVRFAMPLNADGEGSIVTLGFESNAPALLQFEDGERIDFDLPFKNINQISRIALVWDLPISMELNALEFGAGIDDANHIHPGNARTFEDVRRSGGGFLNAFRAYAGIGQNVQIYSHWHRNGGGTGIVKMTIDFVSRNRDRLEETCGSGRYAAPQFLVMQSTKGRPERSILRRLAALDCSRVAEEKGDKRLISGAIGDLVINQ